MFSARPFQLAFQFPEMVVRKDAQDGAAQFRAIDERGVTKFVEEDDIFAADEGGHCAKARPRNHC